MESELASSAPPTSASPVLGLRACLSCLALVYRFALSIFSMGFLKKQSLELSLKSLLVMRRPGRC